MSTGFSENLADFLTGEVVTMIDAFIAMCYKAV
jgi:hypothetical protein